MDLCRDLEITTILYKGEGFPKLGGLLTIRRWAAGRLANKLGNSLAQTNPCQNWNAEKKSKGQGVILETFCNST